MPKKQSYQIIVAVLMEATRTSHVHERFKANMKKVLWFAHSIMT